MLDINILTKEDICDPDIVPDIFAEGNNLIMHGGSQARALALKLEKLLELADKDMPPSLKKDYQDLVSKLKFASLDHFYNKEELFSFFTTQLVPTLISDDVDMYDRIKAKMIDTPIFDRDALKENLRKALHVNGERLTEKYLILDGKEQIGTVANWIRDYIQYVGGGKAESIKIAEYFANGKNVSRLTEDDYKHVQKLIGLYEFLKQSSLTPLGIEEKLVMAYPNGRLCTINEKTGLGEDLIPGRTPSPIKPPLIDVLTTEPSPSEIVSKPVSAPILEEEYIEHKVMTPTEIRNLLTQKTSNEKEVEEEYNVLKAQNLSDSQVIKELYDSISLKIGGKQKSKAHAVALLQLVAEKNVFDILFKDLKFKLKFTEYLKEKHPTEAEGFKLNQLEPRYLGLLIKFICVEKLNLPENDAAQFAVRLGNLMKKAGKPEYMEMAYYDMKEKRFKWK